MKEQAAPRDMADLWERGSLTAGGDLEDELGRSIQGWGERGFWGEVTPLEGRRVTGTGREGEGNHWKPGTHTGWEKPWKQGCGT